MNIAGSSEHSEALKTATLEAGKWGGVVLSDTQYLCTGTPPSPPPPEKNENVIVCSKI